MDRRTFLALGAGMPGMRCRGALHIGELRFCRVPDASWLDVVRHFPGTCDCVVEIDRRADTASFLGSTATLVWDQRGWTLFH